MRVATLHLHDDRGNWVEEYNEGPSFEPGENVEEWAAALVKRFNDTRSPGISERVLDLVEVEEVEDEPETEDEG